MTDAPLTAEDYSALIKEEYDDGKGDKTALLRMIVYCARYSWQVPDWARCALLEVYESAQIGNIKSWDDAFGHPLPKGRQQRGVQTASRKWEVWCKVRDLHEEGLAIDNELFELVGTKLGISGSTVAELYRQVERPMRRIRNT